VRLGLPSATRSINLALRMFPRSRIVPRPLIVLVLTAWGCRAELESTCVAGDCSPYEPIVPPPLECYEGCDVTTVSGRVGEYPCAVDAVIDNCRRCHGAVLADFVPFSLDTYADSQELYGGVARWARINAMVAADLMPFAPPLLDDDEKKTLLDDWACVCAPPRAPGEVCE
jgi:hypothetical protein